MKQAILFTLFIMTTHFCFARPAPAKHDRSACSYADTSAQIPPIGEMLSEIVNVLGLHSDFELKEAKVLNIEASISHRKRYILYNPAFIDWISRATKDKWGVIALLAHEIGHHLEGHTIRRGGSNPEVELEADEFSGFVLNKLGASLQQSQEVMRYIANTQASLTHPARASRMDAIQKGWNRAISLK